jgi:hypothetical protein
MGKWLSAVCRFLRRSPNGVDTLTRGHQRIPSTEASIYAATCDEIPGGNDVDRLFFSITQADAFAGFNALYEARRRPMPIIEEACWAHWRRKFFDLAKLAKAPIAVEALRRTHEIFAIERTFAMEYES